MKGSATMDIILAVIVFAGISLFLIQLAKKVEKQNSTYETCFCRDVRANLGMFAYPSQVESKREKLNRKDSKF